MRARRWHRWEWGKGGAPGRGGLAPGSGRFQADRFRNLPTPSTLHVRRAVDDHPAIAAVMRQYYREMTVLLHIRIARAHLFVSCRAGL
jgi:hypothetical protein